MSYRTIVVHLDDGPRRAARVELAIDLAQRHGSRLLGIAPTGLPDAIVTMNSALPDGVECIALSAAYLRGKAEAVAEAFEQQCRTAGVASFHGHVVVDEAIDAVVRHGRYSDLVVVGQADTGTLVAGVANDFPQQVLLHAGSPVLVVPYAGLFRSVGGRVLVAWKDTREAARALRDSLPLLRRADRVTMIEIAVAAVAPPVDDTLDAAAAWLASHDVAIKAHREIALADVGDQLLSRAAELDADLIVCGGYGHSRLREWVLGGTTRHLLEHMTVPTLLSH